MHKGARVAPGLACLVLLWSAVLAYAVALRVLHTKTNGGRHSYNAAASNVVLEQHAEALQGLVCSAGHLVDSRRVLWRHLDASSPALMEVLHAEDRVYAVFNLKQQQDCQGWCGESGHLKLPWGTEGNWSMLFHGDTSLGLPDTDVSAQPLAADSHGHTLTVFANLPESYGQQQPLPYHTPINVTITATVADGQGGVRQKVYDNVPLCMRRQRQRPYHLTACTGITPAAAAQVPEWVAYHLRQGFEHFTVYVDGDSSHTADKLRPLIEAGVLTLVDFNWPASAKHNWWAQQAIQNSCIMRARGESRWVALHDVDEFMQPLTPSSSSSSTSSTVASFLQRCSAQEHLAAFAVCVFFFGAHVNATQQAAYEAAGQGLQLGTYVSRQEAAVCQDREKLLINPHSTSYVSVHVVTAGGEVQRPSAEMQLRLVHYKLPQQNQYPVTDTSMSKYAGAVRGMLRQWGFA